MHNWDDDDGYCTAADDFQEARAACELLDIPLHRVSFAAQYRERVFAIFSPSIAPGRTPNPDVLCNREIKFGACLRLRPPAGRRAHRHRALCAPRARRGRTAHLYKGAIARKDQSYFLHAVPPARSRPRAVAAGRAAQGRGARPARGPRGLPVATKPRQHRHLLHRRATVPAISWRLPARATPGPCDTPDGDSGRHTRGLAYYTLGQRQGLGIGGRAGGSGAAWFVVGKDACARNTLLVAQGDEHPALYSSAVATDMHWIGAGRRHCRCAARPRCATVRHSKPAPSASWNRGLAGPLRRAATRRDPGPVRRSLAGERMSGRRRHRFAKVRAPIIPPPHSQAPAERSHDGQFQGPYHVCARAIRTT